MDFSVYSACIAPVKDVAAIANSSAVVANSDSHKSQHFADLLSKDSARSHVYVSADTATSFAKGHLMSAISSVESLQAAALAKLERNKFDEYSGQEKNLDGQFNVAADLIAESMRFQVEMVSFQLMSSVLQATRQGINTLFQQQG
jgi:hypothetical protein